MIENMKSEYESMLSSIDFFSQNLHLDQIVEYGFSIFNSLEMPIHSAIYVLNDEETCYEIKFSQGYSASFDKICKNDNHDAFAIRNGFLLIEREVQERYFDKDFLETSEVSKIMPLIIDDKLYGFIISTDGPQGGSLGIDFLTRFNYLMNLSLEKASRYLERAKLRSEIDKKIFNLNSISQTMRFLLSELDTENILQLSIDVIRELTTSSVTSIGIYEPAEDVVKIRSYENLTTGEKVIEQFKIEKDSSISGQVVFRYPDDSEKLRMLFSNPEKFELLNAEYVILLVKESILGFVTIGRPLAIEKYDESLLDRISDIASIMYIGLTNANQFEVISEQKEQLRMQLNVLRNMNRIIKNVNSSESIEELSEMIIDTLSLTFGVEAGMLITFDDGNFKIRSHIGEMPNEITLELIESIQMHMSNDIQAFYTVEAVKNAMGEDILGYFPDINCMIMSPIQITQFQDEPIGCIIITKTKQRLRETQVSMVEVLSNSVGPLLHQLIALSVYKNNYIPKPEYEIGRLYDQYANEKAIYSLDFKVFVKKINFIPFEDIDLLQYEELDVVMIKDVLVIFSQEALNPDLYDDCTEKNPDLDSIKSIIVMRALQ